MLNICSVNVYFQEAPVDHRHIFFIYISFFQRTTVWKNWLREQSLYLCILWFWIV